MTNTNNDLLLAEKITQECERTGTNLCSSFDDWTKCAMSLASLGDEARPLFHKLAALDTQYKQRENDIKFTNCLRTANRTSMASLIYLADNAGIDVKRLREQMKADGYSVQVSTMPQKPRLSESKPQRLQFIQPSVAAWLEGRETTFTRYLAGLFGSEAVNKVIKAYHIGGIEVLKGYRSNGKWIYDGKDERTLFPQIDINGRCRTGKVIRYQNNGHRNKAVYPSWLHTELMKWQEYQKQVTGECPNWIETDFTPTQCLYGEHLLRQMPDAVVGLVEAEKTATTMSLIFPQIVWVAVGGKSMLSIDRLQVLQRRKVKIFADEDAFEDWRLKVARWNTAGLMSYIDYEFVDWSAHVPDKMDIADVYLLNLEARRAKKPQPYIMPDLIKILFPDNPCGLYEMCEKLHLEVENETELRKALSVAEYETL